MSLVYNKVEMNRFDELSNSESQIYQDLTNDMGEFVQDVLDDSNSFIPLFERGRGSELVHDYVSYWLSLNISSTDTDEAEELIDDIVIDSLQDDQFQNIFLDVMSRSLITDVMSHYDIVVYLIDMLEYRVESLDEIPNYLEYDSYESEDSEEVIEEDSDDSGYDTE